MGEILKTGLICDGDFFRYVCCEQKGIKKLDMERIARMVRRCCEIKAGVVERDPKEQGERALLNLGHTVGHAVEKLKNFTLLHGQCVGVGLRSSGACRWSYPGRSSFRNKERQKNGTGTYQVYPDGWYRKKLDRQNSYR